MPLVKSVRFKAVLAVVSVLVVTAGALVGANVASADSVQVQSYQRASQEAACTAQPGETAWQTSWGTDSSWSPSWEQWANAGQGGWTCTRSITWAKTPVTGTSSVTYRLGDRGPGGGLVFLISGGKTYEMAPKAWSGVSDPTDAWCTDVTNSVNTNDAIGTGAANTTAMLTNAGLFVACASGAANAVRAYAGGGKTDWFLPSKDELNAMCNYSRNPTTPASPSVTCTSTQVLTGPYAFTVDSYWSSSQDGASASSAYRRNFNDGASTGATKSGTKLVRPVRSF